MRRMKKRKGIEAQRVKPPTPSWVVIREEEQSGKQENIKKETGCGSPTQRYPGPFSLLLRRAGIIVNLFYLLPAYSGDVILKCKYLT